MPKKERKMTHYSLRWAFGSPDAPRPLLESFAANRRWVWSGGGHHEPGEPPICDLRYLMLFVGGGDRRRLCGHVCGWPQEAHRGKYYGPLFHHSVHFFGIHSSRIWTKISWDCLRFIKIIPILLGFLFAKDEATHASARSMTLHVRPSHFCFFVF